MGRPSNLGDSVLRPLSKQKRALLWVALVACGTSASVAFAQDHTIRTGNFRQNPIGTSVTIAFTNEGEAMIGAVVVSCGFLSSDGVPVGEGSVYLENVAAGDTAYGDAIALKSTDAVRADCRIVSVD